jgi:beta-N-acetylhexosaminidase
MDNLGSIKDFTFWGQLLMVGLPGPRVEEVARGLVRDLKVGGIVLFARNLEGLEQVWQLTYDLQKEALAATGQPLLIALDQEGGKVQRLKSPFTPIPPARQLGLKATAAEVEALARQVARELCLVGVNMNLAPVLDVARGPDCPLWDRSYGRDPQLVATMGTAAIRGFLAGGIIPVAKHFPGLGDTSLDSHEELALAESDNASREQDLLPFRQAVAAGVPIIMTAHLKVPEWDSRPATLSEKILQERLRRDLGFDGVIITDDLEMGAIATRLPAPQAAREALAAGADLMLICKDWQAAWDTSALLAQEAALEPRGRQAAARLRLLRERLKPQTADLEAVKKFFRPRR